MIVSGERLNIFVRSGRGGQDVGRGLGNCQAIRHEILSLNVT